MTQFCEYPKAIYLTPGEDPVIVTDAEHEMTVMRDSFQPQALDDKDALVTQAEGLGIVVDKRWGAARLRAEIDARK